MPPLSHVAVSPRHLCNFNFLLLLSHHHHHHPALHTWYIWWWCFLHECESDIVSAALMEKYGTLMTPEPFKTVVGRVTTHDGGSDYMQWCSINSFERWKQCARHVSLSLTLMHWAKNPSTAIFGAPSPTITICGDRSSILHIEPSRFERSILFYQRPFWQGNLDLCMVLSLTSWAVYNKMIYNEQKDLYLIACWLRVIRIKNMHKLEQ